MFGVEKERLLEGLENIRKRVCCYCGPTCDCKYGIPKPTDRDHLILETGEQTSCPEIRMAGKLIKALSEKEFNRACRRAGILIT